MEGRESGGTTEASPYTRNFAAGAVPAPSMRVTSAIKPPSSVAGSGKRRLRKSCEFCRERKKRCDGDGINRCSLCVAKGNAECVYNERLSTSARNNSSWGRGGQRMAASKMVIPGDAGTGTAAGTGGGGAGVVLMRSRPWDSRADDEASDENGTAAANGLALRAPGPPFSGSIAPFKRCHLTASPATGLVGMQENQFLSDYFDCMGFLPLASECDVRQALVSLLLGSLAPAQREVEGDRHGGRMKRCGTMDETGAIIASERRKAMFPSTDASTCALWCAIALGALVRGVPSASVLGYAQLARESLTSCFDDVSRETARAFTLMAFLCNFLGDEAKFKKYLMFAHGTVRALPPGTVPQEFQDLLKTADSARLYTGVGPSKTETQDFCRKDASPTRTGDIVRKTDLRGLCLQTDHRLEQAFFSDMLELGLLDDTHDSQDSRAALAAAATAAATPSPPAPSPAMDVDASTIVDIDESDRAAGAVEVVLATAGSGSGPSDGERDSGSETPAPVSWTRLLSQEALPEYQRLVEVASWPEIRTGVGGLIFNGTLAYLSGVEDDVEGAVGGVVRFTEVLRVYPGLCRFSMWRHHTHCALSLLAKTRSEAVYEQLRASYNSARPPDTLAVPPIDQWDMEKMCDHVFCRSVLSKIVCPSPGKGGPPACCTLDADLSGETDSEAGEKSRCSATPATSGTGAWEHKEDSKGALSRSATSEAEKGTRTGHEVVMSVTPMASVSSLEETGDPAHESGARQAQGLVQEAMTLRETEMMISNEANTALGAPVGPMKCSASQGRCSPALNEARIRDAGSSAFRVSTKPPPDGSRYDEPLIRGSSFGPSDMLLATSDDVLLRDLLLDGVVEDSVVSKMAV